MIKKVFFFILAFLMLVSQLCTYTSALSLSADGAIVTDLYSDITVYEKNAHKRRGMASTTKIMTALIVIENCPLEKTVCIPSEAVGTEGSSVYLKKGEHLTVEELLYALLLQSANDAAVALAIETSGSIEGFASLMNEKAQELGLQNTHFTNPHGLYDEEHYTTPYDLAVITKCALKNDIFKKIVSSKKAVIPSGDGNGTRVLVNHNKLLSLYDGAIGVKTGFTKKTGRCLVSAAERDGTALVAVTMNAPDDWNDHKKLLDLGFSSISTHRLASIGEFCYKIPVVGGTAEYVTLSNTEGLTYTCRKGKADIRSEIIFPRFCFAPVKMGETLGQIIFYNGKEEIARIDLTAQSDAQVKKQTARKKLFGLF